MLIALAGMFLALALSLGLRNPGEHERPRPAPRRRSPRRQQAPAVRSGPGHNRKAGYIPAPKLSKRERREMLDGMKNRLETDPKRMALLVREYLRDENRRQA